MSHTSSLLPCFLIGFTLRLNLFQWRRWEWVRVLVSQFSSSDLDGHDLVSTYRSTIVTFKYVLIGGGVCERFCHSWGGIKNIRLKGVFWIIAIIKKCSNSTRQNIKKRNYKHAFAWDKSFPGLGINSTLVCLQLIAMYPPTNRPCGSSCICTYMSVMYCIYQLGGLKNRVIKILT